MGDNNTWIAQLRKGSLELCMLALLAGKERYGYDIAKALGEPGGLVIREGTIYPLLSRLQREGLVSARWRESSSGPPRKYYSLTAKGKQALEELSAEWTAFSAAVDRILTGARNGDK